MHRYSSLLTCPSPSLLNSAGILEIQPAPAFFFVFEEQRQARKEWQRGEIDSGLVKARSESSRGSNTAGLF